jgi:hypothetical protein
MWDLEGSGMVPLPNMVADFRDSFLAMLKTLSHFADITGIERVSKTHREIMGIVVVWIPPLS